MYDHYNYYYYMLMGQFSIVRYCHEYIIIIVNFSDAHELL
jgi:hypothetical protein